MGLLINGKGWKVVNDSAVECEADSGFIKVEHRPHFENLTVIDSVKAGKARSNTYSTALKPLLEAAEITHKYIETTSPTTIADFAASLDAPEGSSYLFISGDTSIHEFLNGLKDAQNFKGILAVIPAGTGNALANSLALGSVESAIERFLTGEPQKYPIYRVSTGDKSLYSLVVVSYGFHANLIAQSDTPEYRKLGNERFQVVAKQLLEHPQKYKSSIYLDKSEVPLPNDETSYVLFTTMKMLEPGFTISPEGDCKCLHLVRINAPDNLMEYMMMAYGGGTHVKEPNVDYISAKSARLDIPKDSVICVDGFILKSDGLVDIELGMEVSVVV
ncbi:Sphingosine kinase A [Yarrowia sp. C11]|nr:Sphingosine kinase A [Yarrowia sp. E02]KAG5369275.1 Sphingosine kinase A [Yarrowia sp. C11]